MARSKTVPLMLNVVVIAAMLLVSTWFCLILTTSEIVHQLELSASLERELDSDSGIGRFSFRVHSDNQAQAKNETIMVVDLDVYNYMMNNLHDLPYPGVNLYTKYAAFRLKMKPLSNVKPLLPYLGPVLNDVTSFRYPINVPFCQNNSEPNSSRMRRHSLFVAINSAPGYFKKRELVRKTWANHLKFQSELIDLVGFAFVVGMYNGSDTTVQQRLEEESATHGDIIQVDMIDSYYNITLKVGGLLNWLSIYCSTVDFILKADDDVYVNVRNLATTLTTLTPSKAAAYGTRMPYTDVVRKGEYEKWSISYEMWPWMYYPDFLWGACVLLTGKAIIPLMAGYQTTPFIPFDDVYLTGLAASKAGVQIFSNSRMYSGRGWPPLKPCVVHSSISWLTDAGSEMEDSHRVTQRYYSGVQQCILQDPRSRKPISVDPRDIVKFAFLPVDQ